MMFDQGSPMAYFTIGSTTTHISSSNLSYGGLACSTSFTVQVPNKSATFNWTSHVDQSMPTADFSQIHTYLQYQG
ncbi:hypothetical protein FHW88_000505 [Mucilaginibacter sp. SG538B]|uniref:hypothetical protein n=1 Tax=Mucilaginibacter sp. SG538B TaxID=2587021 RepID=UPI00159E118F|nr:hypothetical protein [Mucilaginibacter sp. SG538B]NVM62229.1 hypothetical protein [Mucilaginibacter sp. SG538B]